MSRKQTIIQGTIILTITGFLSRFMGFFYRIFMSRTFGEEGVGLYQLIFPVYALCFSLTTAGMETAISRSVARKTSLGKPKEAREILAKTNSLRLIVASNTVSGFYETATIDGGLLAQISDHTLFKHWNVVTTRRPTQAQIDAMAFGTMISLGAKSDSAIIINDSAAIGISFGQPNRRKAVLLAVEDAKECFKNGLTSSDTSAEILVSDTSIPFDDKIRNAVEIGVKAIIQTGGSSSDQQLIDYCNENDIAMVFTGMRHIAF